MARRATCLTPADAYTAALRYCALTGGSITSAFRTTVHNVAVGGVKYSAHRFGVGFDVTYDGITPADGAEIARRVGLYLYREGDHDHLQPLDWVKG